MLEAAAHTDSSRCGDRVETALGRPCTVCTHSAADEIDAALEAGHTLRALAAQYGLSDSALDRHARRHLFVGADAGAELAHGSERAAHQQHWASAYQGAMARDWITPAGHRAAVPEARESRKGGWWVTAAVVVGLALLSAVKRAQQGTAAPAAWDKEFP